MKVMDTPPGPQRPGDEGQAPVIYYLQPAAPTAPEDDEIDLRALWDVLARSKALILAVTLLATAAAAALAWLKTPEYEAQVTLAPVEEGKGGGLAALAGQFGGLASLAGIDLGGGGGKTEEAIAILESRQFTEAFIRDHDLLPVLFAERWDPVQKAWNVEAGEDPPDMWDAIAAFDQIRKVESEKKSGLVKLTIRWHDPEQAAAWANELVERVNRHLQEQAVAEAQKSIDYLREQLKTTDVVDMQQAIYRLIEAQTKNIMFAKVRDEYVFRVIDPAVPPDPDDPVSPKRSLMVTLGVVLGLILGVLLAFLRHAVGGKDGEEASA